MKSVTWTQDKHSDTPIYQIELFDALLEGSVGKNEEPRKRGDGVFYGRRPELDAVKEDPRAPQAVDVRNVPHERVRGEEAGLEPSVKIK